MEETLLPMSKKYRGSIRWYKLRFKDGRCKIEKRRPFGNDSYTITQAEYDWITDAKKAEAMWWFRHMIGTAHWFSGELKHPITGQGYEKQQAA